MSLHEEDTGALPSSSDGDTVRASNESGLAKTMKVVDLIQGTPEWLAFRAEHYPASETAIVMGLSPYTTREELMYERKTGNRKPFPEYLAKRGHESEAAARPVAQEILGDELFPATAVCSQDERFSASFDGITMCGDMIWEHKLWSEKLAASVLDGAIPKHYYLQVQHQLMVSGATKCLFMTSDGTSDKCYTMIVKPDHMVFSQITTAWDDFERDLVDFIPEENVPSWAIDELTIDDLPEDKAKRLAALERHYEEAEFNEALAKERKEIHKKEILELLEGKSITGSKFKITTSERKGSVSYAKAFKEYAPDADLEKFRGKPTTVTTMKRIDK